MAPRNAQKGEFSKRTVRSFDGFIKFIKSIESIKGNKQWIYRGEEDPEYKLQTSLERTLTAWDIKLNKAPDIERQLIREFRRKYNGDDKGDVLKDTLYCLALMRHHRAPTRLLDWTYSPFVAAKFASEKGPITEKGKRTPVIWCINSKWCSDAAKGEKPGLSRRDRDDWRNDKTFIPIYMGNARKRFVHQENPLSLNARLIVQQGLFLCPGDVSASFEENLRRMDGWKLEKNVVKLSLDMDTEAFKDFADHLRKMNISDVSLFPGLDGFARSLGEHIFHYEYLSDAKTGQ